MNELTLSKYDPHSRRSKKPLGIGMCRYFDLWPRNCTICINKANAPYYTLNMNNIPVTVWFLACWGTVVVWGACTCHPLCTLWLSTFTRDEPSPAKPRLPTIFLVKSADYNLIYWCYVCILPFTIVCNNQLYCVLKSLMHENLPKMHTRDRALTAMQKIMRMTDIYYPC